ncbi:MAG: hypothetical protein U0525_04325 [Patescibacteria group bacterium]
MLDNVEDFEQVKLFLPNSYKCTVFLLTRNSEIDLEQEFGKVEVKPFNKNEVLTFFKAKLKNNFDPKLANHYLKVSELVKGVPSALNIVADQIKQSNIFSTEQKTDIPAKLPHYYILSGLFSLLTILWLGEKMMNISPSKAFTFSYWLVPLYGSVIGFSSARKMVKNFSIFFYPVLFLAIGLLMQVFGQLSYSYYQFIYLFYADRTFVHGIPYPSTGDIGYFGSVVFYILSLSCLIYNLKNKWSPKSNVYITLALLIFCIFLTTSYTTLLRGVIFDFQNPIKLILDLGYPLGQSIYVSLAVFAFILSTGFLGGYLNKPVLVMLSGLIIQFVADTMFIYQANLGTWVYGNLNDYLYLVAYFITSIGIVKLGNTVINSTQNNVAISKVSNIFKKIFAINNVIFSLFSLLVIVWVVEKVLKLWTQDIYTAIYFSMALFGGLLGLVTVKLIGNIHKPLSKALLGLSLGLLGQVFGQLVYEYYYLTSGIELAYPSVGEMGYFGSIFFYIYAAYQFILMLRSKQYSLRIVNFVISIILPLVFLIGSYYIFLNGRTFAHINTIKVVLDIGYPLFQSVYVSLAIFAFILSRGYIGGIFNRSASIILAGFITQYIADSMFVYQFSLGTWTAGGVNDLIFTVAYTLMTLGIASFHRAITVNAYNN